MKKKLGFGLLAGASVAALVIGVVASRTYSQNQSLSANDSDYVTVGPFSEVNQFPSASGSFTYYTTKNHIPVSVDARIGEGLFVGVVDHEVVFLNPFDAFDASVRLTFHMYGVNLFYIDYESTDESAPWIEYDRDGETHILSGDWYKDDEALTSNFYVEFGVASGQTFKISDFMIGYSIEACRQQVSNL